MLVLFGLLLGAFLTGTRFLVHLLYQRPWNGFRPRRDARSVLIVGAGDGGRLLLNELLKNPALGYRPVGFVDDDPKKQGMAEVHGTIDDLPEVLDDVEPDEVMIAIPSAPGHAAGGGRQRLPQPAASRCARCRPSSSWCRPAASSRASCATSRSRTCWAATRCGWRSSPSAAT